MPLTLAINPSRGRRDGSVGTAARMGTFPALRGASPTPSTDMLASEGSDSAGGMASPVEAVIAVIEGDPDGDSDGEPLRALRAGNGDAPGSMLGDPPLGGPARCTSEGLEQRILLLATDGGWPLARKVAAASTLHLAATLQPGLLMGAFLSQCICQIGNVLGMLKCPMSTGPLPTDPLARADAAASCIEVKMDDVVEPPAKAARQGVEPVVALIVPFTEHLPATSPFPKGDDDGSDLLLACQRAVLDGYVTLVHRGVLPCGLDVRNTAMEAGAPLCHAIQDPTGALTAALLIVRRNRDNLTAGNPRSMSGGRLGVVTRRVLGAILCVTHKMTAHPACCSYRTYAQHCVEVMQSPFDVPKHEIGWAREMSAMMYAERAVLSEPLLALTTENPIGEMEHILDHLQRVKGLDEEDAYIIRGMAFYFLGSLLFQRDIAGVDAFMEHLGMRAVAAGCVVGSFACFAVACLKEGASGRKAAAHATSIVKSGGIGVRRATGAVLAAASAPESDLLRHGPFDRYPKHHDGVAHPVQLLLHPSNLVRAKAKAMESGWTTDVKN